MDVVEQIEKARKSALVAHAGGRPLREYMEADLEAVTQQMVMLDTTSEHFLVTYAAYQCQRRYISNFLDMLDKAKDALVELKSKEAQSTAKADGLAERRESLSDIT